MVKFCSLYSGSSGNAVFIASERAKILIDCGVSGKKITASLADIDVNASEIDGILVTHEHSDHSYAVGIMSRRHDIPIYANESTWVGMEGEIGSIKPENKRYIQTHKDFEIKDVHIHPFSIPHDAAEPVGYNFFIDNKKITLATDIGHVNEQLVSYLEGSDMVLLEANHDIEMLKCGSYPYFLKQRILGDSGHLSNDAAASLVAHLVKKGMTNCLLGHLSKENNFPELAFRTVYNILEENNIKVGKDTSLEVAIRDRTSKVYNL